MKKVVYLLFALGTCYLGGVYRYPPLMLLFVMEIALLPVFYCLSRYFRTRLTVEIPCRSEVVEKAAVHECRIRVQNSGRLPISRFRIRLCCGYRQDARKKRKQIYGGSNRGSQELYFELYPRYCGLVELELSHLRTYDYLSLFSASKKISQTQQLAVFPQKKTLVLELPVSCYRDNDLSQQSLTGQGGDAHNEIRQLREYRTGDSNRYIHWNQSARMDQLWVKEYEREVDYRLELLVDVEGFSQASVEQLDAFYELLAALVLGLLRKAAVVRVHWYEGLGGGLASHEIAEERQCRDMLARLYRLEERGSREEKAALEGAFMLEGSFFRLDLGLNWYWNEELVYQFHPQNLEEELAKKAFAL